MSCLAGLGKRQIAAGDFICAANLSPQQIRSVFRSLFVQPWYFKMGSRAVSMPQVDYAMFADSLVTGGKNI